MPDEKQNSLLVSVETTRTVLTGLRPIALCIETEYLEGMWFLTPPTQTRSHRLVRPSAALLWREALQFSV